MNDHPSITACLSNWKTTIAGAVLAGLEAYHIGAFQDPDDLKKWLIPVSIAVLGFLVRDADKSSEKSGIK